MSYSDKQLLEEVQRRAVRFFWEKADWRHCLSLWNMVGSDGVKLRRERVPLSVFC